MYLLLQIFPSLLTGSYVLFVYDGEDVRDFISPRAIRTIAYLLANRIFSMCSVAEILAARSTNGCVITAAQRLQIAVCTARNTRTSQHPVSVCLLSYILFCLWFNSLVKKLKLSHYTPRRRLGEDRKYSSYSFSTSALDGVSGQLQAPATLFPREKDPRYPLDRRLGGPQSRSGHRG
jgi:hypothetical protein